MKRLLILNFLLLCMISFHASAQTYVTQVKIKNGRWGYANLKGEIIIPATFRKCLEFTGNLAIVFDDEAKQYYFLNINGKRVRSELPKFTIQGGYYSFGGSLFADGLLAVENGKWGYLNNFGKVAIPVQFAEASVFNGGYATVKLKNDYFVIDTAGNKTAINVKVINGLNHFSEGLASYRDDKDHLGFINHEGLVKIQPEFKSVGYFVGGVAWAKTLQNKVGYIDSLGKWIVQPNFDEAHDFDPMSERARIKIGEKSGYTNMLGEVSYLDTDNYSDYSEGYVIGEKNAKFGFLNAKGEWVISAQFDGLRSFKNGYAAAKSGEKWGVIDKEGKWIMAPQFYGIRDMELVYGSN
ncbi:WG repeat-containing protein [uncultured Cytophaga sp.]|uniref:WG repeat-containing protein n=1 Tax=uncultured Cytophaga sp. TaxID=160238 RepID=UPI0026314100|nr:WG repeat-containing protein [uncultured Cytophaga sp.]